MFLNKTTFCGNYQNMFLKWQNMQINKFEAKIQFEQYY